jgi:osmotically-inducible protein OsmY
MAREPLSSSVKRDLGVNWLVSGSAQAAKERTSQVNKTTDVRAAVEKELDFDPMVDSRDIAVRNINGDVTLTGTVPSYPQYLEAAR